MLRTMHRYLSRSSCKFAQKLSSEEVTSILERQQARQHVEHGSCAVLRVDSNQLPANLPCEDRLSQHSCLGSSDMIFGVYDGHGGDQCVKAVSRRLPAYIAATTLSPGRLRRHLAAVEEGSQHMFSLLQSSSGEHSAIKPPSSVELSSYVSFLRRLLESPVSSADDPQRALSSAFVQLDSDIGREAVDAVSNTTTDSQQLLAAAESGCVACVAHVRAGHLLVASAGDCRAVLGVRGEGGRWTARALSWPHTSQHAGEVRRVRDAHPSSECNQLLANGRLLGLLAPLRAFGDFHFKWSRQLQTQLAAGGDHASPTQPPPMLPGLLTPPYLTAAPDVQRHKLTPRDRFLLVASDGLWDLVGVQQAVQLVGSHADGRTSLARFKLPLHRRASTAARQLAALLERRRRSLDSKPADGNAATHALRHALSGSSLAGLNDARIGQMLQLPAGVAREYRDDISVLVVMFDADYLRRHL